MNKKGQWNIGLGTAFIIGGLYLLTREKAGFEIIIPGIILIGIGVWLITK